jgi:hypothetical protein
VLQAVTGSPQRRNAGDPAATASPLIAVTAAPTVPTVTRQACGHVVRENEHGATDQTFGRPSERDRSFPLHTNRSTDFSLLARERQTNQRPHRRRNMSVSVGGCAFELAHAATDKTRVQRTAPSSASTSRPPYRQGSRRICFPAEWTPCPAQLTPRPRRRRAARKHLVHQESFHSMCPSPADVNIAWTSAALDSAQTRVTASFPAACETRLSLS